MRKAANRMAFDFNKAEEEYIDGDEVRLTLLPARLSWRLPGSSNQQHALHRRPPHVQVVGLGTLGNKEGTGRLRVVANQQKVKLTGDWRLLGMRPVCAAAWEHRGVCRAAAARPAVLILQLACLTRLLCLLVRLAAKQQKKFAGRLAPGATTSSNVNGLSSTLAFTPLQVRAHGLQLAAYDQG
jgi:hypothetical protein